MSTLRRWFLSGLLVLLPLGVTLWVLSLALSLLDGSIGWLPKHWQPEAWLGFRVPGMGVVLMLVVVLVVGAIASNYVGFRLVRWWDGVLGRIPVVRSIYSGVKQVSDTLFSDKGHAFREVVLLQFPRQGIWTIAFVTGHPGGAVEKYLDSQLYLNVFVPTAPNPTSGYFIIVPRSDVIELDMSVDDALKVVVSMGVIVPPVVPAAPDGVLETGVEQNDEKSS